MTGRRFSSAGAYDRLRTFATPDQGFEKLDLEEAAHRQTRPGGPEQEPGAEQGERIEPERQGMDVAAAADVRRERRERDLLAEHQQDHGDDRADEPAEEPFEHERPADEPVGRPD